MKRKNIGVKFSEITGHKEITTTLQTIADSGQLPHALLFTGKAGVGKMRTARALAQYLHCKNKKGGDSCGICPSCRQHQKYNNPDLHYIYPVVKKDGILISKDLIGPWKEMLENYSYMSPEKWNELINAGNSQPAIYVDESEEILARASLSAYQEDLKIFIIWQPEKMRPEAANKILKIIEEPYEDTVFLLVSNDETKILPTIISRSQKYNFQPLLNKEISQLLQKSGIDKDLAEEAALLGEGSFQKAEEIACHPEEMIEFSDYFKELMRSGYSLKPKKLKELTDSISAFGREKIIRFLNHSARMVRDNYIYNFQIPDLLNMTKEEDAFSRKFSPFIHEGNVEYLEAEISRATRDIERNGNSKIVLFDLSLLISRLLRKPRTTILPFPEFEERI